MRSILMILGVTIHTASMYAVNASWAYTNPVTSINFDGLIYFLHAFRIPVFYMISGFFSIFMLVKTGSKSFLKNKVIRILLPLFTTAVTLNVFETYFRHIIKNDVPDFEWFLFNILPKSFLNGEWDHHLWFLIYVFIFFTLSVFIFQLISNKDSNIYKITKKVLATIRPNGLFIFLFPTATIMILGIGKFLPFTYIKIFNLFTIIDLMYWFPFFLFGMWLFIDEKLQDEFMKLKKWHLIVMIVFFLTISIKILTINPNNFPKQIIPIFDIYVSWFLCLGAFLVGYKLLNKKSQTWLYLSDASYSIYLFHHLLVMVVGYFIREIELSIYVKFIFVNVLVTLITILLHHFLILRINLLRILFNGKPLKKNLGVSTEKSVEHNLGNI